MNTSQKIVSFEVFTQLLAVGNWVVAIGRFDPLTCLQADRLAKLAENRSLMVVVTDAERTLLPPSARARLVAALRYVSAVFVPAGQDWRAAIDGAQIDENDTAEQARSAEFIRLVASRH